MSRLLVLYPSLMLVMPTQMMRMIYSSYHPSFSLLPLRRHLLFHSQVSERNTTPIAQHMQLVLAVKTCCNKWTMTNLQQHDMSQGTSTTRLLLRKNGVWLIGSLTHLYHSRK